MWRAFFLALGIYCCVLGAECLLIEKATLTGQSSQGTLGIGARKREVVPSDWAPWSLLSAGTVTILYSFTLPQRLHKT
jgi:hypothetical protein